MFFGTLGSNSSLLWTNHPNGADVPGEPEGSDLINNIMFRFNESLHYTHHDICLEGQPGNLLRFTGTFIFRIVPMSISENESHVFVDFRN